MDRVYDLLCENENSVQSNQTKLASIGKLDDLRTKRAFRLAFNNFL